MSKDKFISVARQIPFDNSTNGFTSSDTQSAIEELKDQEAASASPGFSFGRSGNTPSNTYLLNESVPSNKSGRTVSLYNAFITQVWSNNEDISTYDVELYSHDGNEINLTLLTTLSVVASRTGSLSTNVSVPFGKQIAAKVSTGSCKNVLCGLIIKGSLTP